MTVDSGNVRFADIRGGSQDLCKFSLDFMPVSLYYVFVLKTAQFIETL